MPETDHLANRCLQCGRRLKGSPSALAGRKYCSQACVARAKRPAKVTCPKCKKKVLWERYPFPNGKRARCCADCYRPHGPAPLVEAPNPCGFCRRKFSDAKPPSRMKLRRFCSKACERAGKQRPERRCTGCQRVRDRAYFLRADGRRSNYCAACRKARAAAQRAAFGYMAPFKQAYRHARDIARASKVPFTLTEHAALQAYGKPCNFCGEPSCVYRPSVAGSGFDNAVVGVLCWMCWRVSRAIPGGVTEEELLRWAKGAVRRLSSNIQG